MKIEIKPGAIRVNEVTLLIDLPNVKVFEMDMTSKYAEVIGTGGDDERMTILLTRGSNTMKFDPDRRDELTEVRFTFPEHERGFWNVVHDTFSRYSIRVVFFLYPGTEDRD